MNPCSSCRVFSAAIEMNRFQKKMERKLFKKSLHSEKITNIAPRFCLNGKKIVK